MKNYRSVIYLMGPGATEYCMESFRGEKWNSEKPNKIRPDGRWNKYFSTLDPVDPRDNKSGYAVRSRNTISHIAPLIEGTEKAGTEKILFVPTAPRAVEYIRISDRYRERTAPGTLSRRMDDYIPDTEMTIGIGTAVSNTPSFGHGYILVPGEARSFAAVGATLDHNGEAADQELQFGEAGLVNTIERLPVSEVSKVLTISRFSDREKLSPEDCYSEGYACTDFEAAAFLHTARHLRDHNGNPYNVRAGLALAVAEVPGEESRELGDYKEDPLHPETQESLMEALFGAVETSFS